MRVEQYSDLSIAILSLSVMDSLGAVSTGFSSFSLPFPCLILERTWGGTELT